MSILKSKRFEILLILNLHFIQFLLLWTWNSATVLLLIFIEQDSIQVEMDGYAKNIQFRVTKYSIVIVPKIGELSEFKCTGSKISQQVKDAMAVLKEGDNICLSRQEASAALRAQRARILVRTPNQIAWF